MAALAILVPAAALTFASEAAAGKKGTFVEVDVNLGLSMSPHTDMGLAFGYGGLVGIGGKLEAFPPRLYFMAGVLHQGFDGSGIHPQSGESYRAEQSLLDIPIGLRVVIPLWRGLRVHVDVMALAARMAFESTRGDLGPHESIQWIAGGLLAVGLQYRWHRNLGTGIRLDYTFYGNLDAAAMEMVGMDRTQPGKLFVAVVQSFYF